MFIFYCNDIVVLLSITISIANASIAVFGGRHELKIKWKKIMLQVPY